MVVPLLDEFAEHTDFSKMDVQTTRTVGHLSERLLNIFLAHKQRTGANWKIKRLQCVHFLHPEPFAKLEPLQENPETIVPVVLQRTIITFQCSLPRYIRC